MKHETAFYWFVELLVQPPRYLRSYDGGRPIDPLNRYLPFQFTPDIHLADRMNKGQAEVIADKFIEAGMHVEAREHGFMSVDRGGGQEA